MINMQFKWITLTEIEGGVDHFERSREMDAQAAKVNLLSVIHVLCPFVIFAAQFHWNELSKLKYLTRLNYE